MIIVIFDCAALWQHYLDPDDIIQLGIFLKVDPMLCHQFDKVDLAIDENHFPK